MTDSVPDQTEIPETDDTDAEASQGPSGFADAESYFLVTAPQVGVAFGGEAEEVAGIGDRAVWGGGPDGGELWILDGGRLIGMVGDGVGRAAILRLARRYRRTTHSPT